MLPAGCLDNDEIMPRMAMHFFLDDQDPIEVIEMVLLQM
jgi:hypothetical protein